MGLGQWSCSLKTPLQTFDTVTAIALITPHLCIILVMASDFLGKGDCEGRGMCRFGGRNLIFYLKRTE